MMRVWIVALSVLVLLGAAGLPAPAQTVTALPGKPPDGAAPGSEEYRIGPEDVLQIVVWKNDTLTRSVSVRPDGRISLPLLDDVQAAGRTTRELREQLARRLTEFMPAPEVSVIVAEIRSIKVSVIGEVPKPGRYELKSRTTVLDILAQAGGLAQYAARARIVVLRPEGGKMKRIPFNYNKVIASGGEDENFYLEPGDIVVVP